MTANQPSTPKRVKAGTAGAQVCQLLKVACSQVVEQQEASPEKDAVYVGIVTINRCRAALTLATPELMAFIVRACDSHDRLVEALKRVDKVAGTIYPPSESLVAALCEATNAVAQATRGPKGSTQ